MTILSTCKVTRSRLTEGRSDGVDLLEIDNGVLRILLLPQRGMGIWKVFLGDTAFGWRSPVSGPVHPALVPLQDASGLGWLEGFDELMCRCGLQSNGPPVFDAQGRLAYSLHGRIANLPAESVEIRHDESTGRVDVVGVVREVRFLQFNLRLTSTLTVHPNERHFTVSDEVTNLSSSTADCQLMYHYNVGLPVLSEGAQVVAPIRELAPRDARAAEGVSNWASIEPPTAGFAEQVYYTTLHARPDGTTHVLLKAPGGHMGTGLRFNVDQLPCFVVWKNAAGAGEGYVVGIEPSTNFPNPRPFEIGQGRTFSLEPGGSRRFDVQFEYHDDAAQVQSAEAEIQALQQAGAPTIHPQPTAGWSPGGR